jgi:lipid A ethanolaminephosphotransferase
MDSSAAEVSPLADRAWRLSNLYWIKDKEGKRIRFAPNWAQQRAYERLAHNNLELKVRQLGITTGYCMLWLDTCLFNKDVSVGVIAHTKEDAKVIFRDKIKFAYDNLPPELRAAVPTVKETESEMIFANGSSIRVGLTFRSGTVQILHVTEYGYICAHYPRRAQEIRTGAFEAVPKGGIKVNVARTDRHEAGDLLQFSLFAHVVLQGLLPAWLVMRWPLRWEGAGAELLRRLMLVGALVVGLLCVFLPQQHELMIWGRIHRDVRVYVNPTFPLHSVKRYVQDILPRGPRLPPQPIATDAVRSAAVSTRPLLVVLVVGETTRAANFQLNGYGRETTPRLAKIPGLVNFPNVSACGTYTAESVPCMFSIDDRGMFSRGREEKQENLVDLLKRVGVKIGWLDNDSGCQNVCNRVGMVSLDAVEDPLLCEGGECRDGILLRDLPQQFPGAGAKLLVLHTKGSHGPAYYKRYPESARAFTPDCRDVNVQRCTREELVNAYDNTIVYIDQVLSDLVAKLEAQQGRMDSVMIYVSDHGESLGEDSIYLHGLPWKLAPEEQRQVPMVAWFSRGAPQALGLDLGCVGEAAVRPRTHDDIFSTMLGLFSVKTRAYESREDLFGACRRPAMAGNPARMADGEG